MDSENITEDISFENVKDNIPVRNYHKKKNEYKEKECKVIRYNKNARTLDIMFDGFGIRIKDIEEFNNDSTIIVKYKSEIGKSDFFIKI